MSADLQILNNLKSADEITKRLSLNAEQLHALNADCFDEMRPEHVAQAIGVSDIARFFKFCCNFPVLGQKSMVFRC